MPLTREQECFNELVELRKKYGTGNFDFAMRKMRRMRIEPGREDRKRFPWTMYKRLYQKQAGLCPRCCGAMILLRGKVEIDHYDPNAEDYNGEANLRLLHTDCNREKSAKTPLQEAKATGQIITDTLSGEPLAVDPL